MRRKLVLSLVVLGLLLLVVPASTQSYDDWLDPVETELNNEKAWIFSALFSLAAPVLAGYIMWELGSYAVRKLRSMFG